VVNGLIDSPLSYGNQRDLKRRLVDRNGLFVSVVKTQISYVVAFSYELNEAALSSSSTSASTSPAPTSGGSFLKNQPSDKPVAPRSLKQFLEKGSSAAMEVDAASAAKASPAIKRSKSAQRSASASPTAVGVEPSPRSNSSPAVKRRKPPVSAAPALDKSQSAVTSSPVAVRAPDPKQDGGRKKVRKGKSPVKTEKSLDGDNGVKSENGDHGTSTASSSLDNKSEEPAAPCRCAVDRRLLLRRLTWLRRQPLRLKDVTMRYSGAWSKTVRSFRLEELCCSRLIVAPCLHTGMFAGRSHCAVRMSGGKVLCPL